MRMLKLELKRVLKTRMTAILLLLALLLSFALAVIPISFPYVTLLDENGDIVKLMGMEAVRCEQAAQAPYAGTVTTEKVRMALEDYQAVLKEYGVEETYDLPKGVYATRILPYSAYLYGIREAFADPVSNVAPSLMDIDPEQIDDFYRLLEQRNRDAMVFHQPDDPAAQRAGVQKFSQVTKPYEFYPEYPSDAMDYQVMLGFLVLCLCALIAAPVFASDYETGADDILRCTRHGRGSFAWTKILSALLISGAAMVLCSGIYIVVSNSLFGWECTKTSMQLLFSIVSLLDKNVGQLQVFTAATGLLSLLATVCLILFLSSKCRNVLVALSVSLGVCIAPMVLYMTLPSGIRQWIYFLIPSSGSGLQTSILYESINYFYITVGDFALWLPHAMIAACAVEIPLFVLLTIRSYTKRWSS